ncbi:transmembrane amino acid transporter protein-domain-containing protein [Zychaea mexicana]|uniref:transmembrane amino acid transporter protein-domain-containing protein n=1 Tax=Zychaea mexicana TaxID=64656 RepID=UPI0022FE412D|nr:transmembrane amino acid transporter protein-domain-containing protein [Zychaea mexicana]KAI9494583.1 transmembrane amino acid transporter protein-domain-containing protein [Zychaea mexicana]
MERSLTADLPVEQVARVVRRHLVIRPTRSQHASSSNSVAATPIASQIPRRTTYNSSSTSSNNSHRTAAAATPAPPTATTATSTATATATNQSEQGSYSNNQQDNTTSSIYSTHHLLPGGAIVDEIYKWTARVENEQQLRRQRAESISLPAVRPSISDPLLQSLKQPGGFRRHYVLSKAARQGKSPPNFVTSSFVEFLCLYGHFGGEDLSDDDEESSSSSLSSLSDEETITTATTGHRRHHNHHHNHQEEEGLAYRGNNMINRASYQSCDTSTNSNSRGTSNSNGINHQRINNISNNNDNNGGESSSRSESNLNGEPPLLPLPASTSSTRNYPVQFHQLQARETMPLMSRSRPGQTLQGKATPGKAMFLLLKSFVTTGIMFLPKAFYNGGLVFSTVGIIIWALISLWSFLLLVQTRLVVHASFGDMGGVLYGPKMKVAVLVAITLSQIGFVCAYMVFVAENLQSLVLAFSKCRVLLPMHLLILAQSFAFIPLAMIRKIQRLSVFALIADVFIVIGLLYLFYYDLKELVVIGVGDVTVFWNPIHFPLFIGTVAFTYEGIGLVIPITESMKEPQKFPGVLRRTLMVITILFILLGAISYLAFGEDVQTIILLNLPSKDPMVSSIQTLYSLAICLSIPLQLFPAIRIMENGLFTTRSGKNNAVVKWQKNVFRVLVVFLCAWIAIVGSRDKLDKFVSLIGALFCIPLCFVFPPLFHIKALSLPPMRRAADIALIGFGVIWYFNNLSLSLRVGVV